MNIALRLAKLWINPSSPNIEDDYKEIYQFIENKLSNDHITRVRFPTPRITPEATGLLISIHGYPHYPNIINMGFRPTIIETYSQMGEQEETHTSLIYLDFSHLISIRLQQEILEETRREVLI